MTRGAGWTDACRVEVVKTLGQRGLLIATAALLAVFKGIVWLQIRGGSGAEELGDFTVNGFHLVARSAYLGLNAWLVLLVLHASGAIAGEAERGILRAFCTRPVSRPGLYAGKLCGLGALIAFALLADIVLGVACGLPLGFSDVADTDLEGARYGAASLTGEIAAAYLLTALAFLATASVGLMVSALCSQAGTAAALTIFVLVSAAAIGFVFQKPVDRYLITTWNQEWFAELDKLTSGTSVPFREPYARLAGTSVALATLVAAWIAGAFAFARREITE